MRSLKPHTFFRRPVRGVEAELLERLRARVALRSPLVIWALLAISIALSIGSILQAEADSAQTSLEIVTLLLAVAVAVVLISAGALTLHRSRESRWDAPLTVGIGSLLLGIGTFEQVLTASAAIEGLAEPGTDAVVWALAVLRWAGLCLVVGGLVWRSRTGWSARVRVGILAAVMTMPVAVATAWTVTGERGSPAERAVLVLLAVLLLVTAIRLLRHDPSAPLMEGGTVLGSGLALAVLVQSASVHPGDVASIAALSWLLVAGLLTALWFERQAALRAVSHRSQTERYLRLIEDTRQEIDRALDDRSVLRHNGTSSLLAIEGGLDALGASLASGDVTSHERMTRALMSEIGRLRRMLDEAQAATTPPRATLIEAVDAIVHLSRSRGQLIAVNVPESASVIARPDAVAEILHNLLDNAATHAPGSMVAIEATETDRGLVELVVQDDGPGIPAAMREHLFEEGVSSRPGPNRGLGLFAARRLAREAGGELQLLPGTDGACFRLLLRSAPASQVSDLRVVGSEETGATS